MNVQYTGSKQGVCIFLVLEICRLDSTNKDRQMQCSAYTFFFSTTYLYHTQTLNLT